MIVLASQSHTRKSLLSAAGVTFSTRNPGIDETHEIARLSANTDVALHLACEKARSISGLPSTDLIIGSDQTLHCEGQLFHKPLNRTAARAQLLQLRAKTHTLTSAVACVRASRLLWQHTSTARITMRPYSDQTLEHYLDTAGDTIFSAVGSYHYEGLGIQLMATVEGDYHTILGFPVLPLLAFLRNEGYVQA